MKCCGNNSLCSYSFLSLLFFILEDTLGDLYALVCGLIGTETSQLVAVELGQLFGTEMVISCLLNVEFIKIYK